MAKIHMIAKLQSEIRHHGARAVSAKPSKAAAIAKINKNFLSKTDAVTGLKETKERDLVPMDHKPKEYGKHDGQKHAVILGGATFEEFSDVSDILNRIGYAMSTFENQESIDIKAKKEQYRVDRDSITRKIKQLHGGSVDGSVMAEYQNACSKKSFTYTASQITIIMWSVESFPGSTHDKRRNLYVAAFPCKSLYTNALLEIGFVKQLITIVKSGTKPEFLNSNGHRTFSGVVEISTNGVARIKVEAPVLGSNKNRRQRNSVDREGWSSFEDEE